MTIPKTLPTLMTIAFTLTVVACSTAPIEEERRATTSKEGGRWLPVESNAKGTYEGLDGEGCSGGLKPGTKQLGDQLKDQFNTSYGGYACRANTANTSQLSIHAVGRALDISASGTKGDQIANHLVTNAETLGIQLIIWNHTVWKVTASGPASKEYTGPNPHTDHVHAEVNNATARSGPGSAPLDPGMSQTGEGPTDGTQGAVDTTRRPSNNPEGEWTGPTSMGEGELECRMDIDCNPNGRQMCDAGFCF